MRSSREADVVQQRYDAYVASTQTQIASLKAEHAEQLENLHRKLGQQHRIMQTLRIQHRDQLRKQKVGSITVAAVREKRMQGGNSKPTLIKMAKRVEKLMSEGFASLDTRQKALFQHYLRHRKDYQLIIADAVNSKAAFERLCRLHPEWLHPHQRAVIKEIEEAWTLDQCLAVQIHCKVGHSEKYQSLINLLGKTYNSRLRKWIPREIMGKGSKVFLPLPKPKNRVNAHREALHAIIPLLQNKDGTSCWTDLKQLIEETVGLDREKGYLQSRVQLGKDKVWLHWGGPRRGVDTRSVAQHLGLQAARKPEGREPLP